MADNYLNNTGLTYYHNRIKALFASQSDLDALDAKVDEIISEGGEPNVIETVKVNGTALAPDAQKAVDVTVPTATSDLTNDGDGTDSNSPFATQAYVAANGGKIDVIKVNGTAQTIANKEVNLAVPTAVSDLTNDSGFQTSSDVSTAISTALANGNDHYMTESDVDSAIDAKVAGVYHPKGSIAFANLPALSSANEGNVYNITDAFTTTADFVEGAGHAHGAGANVAIVNVGTESSPSYKYDVMSDFVDTSAFWTSTGGQANSLIAITTAQVDALFA